MSTANTLIVPCPHCGAARDTSHCLTGDVLYCSACDKWSTVRHWDGGVATLTKREEPPVSWPKRNGKVRRP